MNKKVGDLIEDGGRKFTEGREYLAAEQVKLMQTAMGLSDTRMVELLGFSPNTGLRRLRRWHDGSEAPTGSAAKLLVMAYRLDRGVKLMETGEWDRAQEVFRGILPDFMQ